MTRKLKQHCNNSSISKVHSDETRVSYTSLIDIAPCEGDLWPPTDNVAMPR